MNERKDWHHAALSLGLLLFVFVCAYFLLVYPALAKRTEMNESYADLEFQYNRFAASIREKDKILAELDTLRSSEMDQSQFLDENSPALAAADLQSRIKSLIENYDADLVSTQVIAGKTDETFPMITIKVHTRGNIESLQEIIYQLEASETVLLIDNLYIQKRTQATRRARNRQTRQQPVATEILDIRFEISGFIYQNETA